MLSMDKQVAYEMNVFLTGLNPRLKRALLPWFIRNPRYVKGFRRLNRGYKDAGFARTAAAKDGVMVPPFLIVSITDRCNLRCHGCYADAAGISPVSSMTQVHGISTVDGSAMVDSDLDIETWKRTFKDAADTGVFGFVIAGGEPFMFDGLLDICASMPDRIFLIITNGTLVTSDHIDQLKKMPNISVVVSLEGDRVMTDARRGEGTYQKAISTMVALSRAGVLTGFSTTITRLNFRYWMGHDVIDDLITNGARFGFFLEHIPVSPGSAAECVGSLTGLPGCADLDDTELVRSLYGDDAKLMLTPTEREAFRERVLDFRMEKAMFVVHSPGDEEFFGGCVSAGRGFAHVTPAGHVTPCPVSDVTTHNLTQSSLKEALASELFREIRENEHLLETEGSPCALFAHPEEVDELARRVGATRTGKDRI